MSIDIVDMMSTVLDNPVKFLAEAALSRENEMKSIVARHRPLPSPLGDHLPSGVSRPIWVGESDMAEQGGGGEGTLFFSHRI